MWNSKLAPNGHKLELLFGALCLGGQPSMVLLGEYDGDGWLCGEAPSRAKALLGVVHEENGDPRGLGGEEDGRGL